MSKVGIGCVLVLSGMIIPVVGQVALLGWTSLALRRAVQGQDSPLPRLDFDFNYLGKLLGIGFKGFLARLIWSLPIMAIAMLFFCCAYAGMGAAVAGLSGGGNHSGDDGAVLGLVMTIVMLVMYLLLFVVIMLLSLPIQIAMLRAELTDELNSAMKFGEVLAMTRMLLGDLIKGMIVMMLIGMAVGFVGVATCYIGLFPGVVVMAVIQTYWMAEIYKVYLQKGGTPLQVGPLDVEGGNLGTAPPPPQF